jgi:hypothetical protein
MRLISWIHPCGNETKMDFNPIWMNCSVLKKNVKSLIRTKEGSYEGFNGYADALLILLSFPGQNCVRSCLFIEMEKNRQLGARTNYFKGQAS